MTPFVLGILFTLAGLVGFCANPKRLRWIARTTEAVADAWEPRRKRNQPEKPEIDEREVSEACREVTSALIYLGVPRRKAGWAATSAIGKLQPGATFDDHFRAAVGIAKGTT